MFNCYAGAFNTYGNHVDAAIRYAPGGRVRTDLSCTLFLSDPDEYEGGDRSSRAPASGAARAAGDMVLYPEHQRAPRRAGHAR